MGAQNTFFVGNQCFREDLRLTHRIYGNPEIPTRSLTGEWGPLASEHIPFPSFSHLLTGLAFSQSCPHTHSYGHASTFCAVGCLANPKTIISVQFLTTKHMYFTLCSIEFPSLGSDGRLFSRCHPLGIAIRSLQSKPRDGRCVSFI